MISTLPPTKILEYTHVAYTPLRQVPVIRGTHHGGQYGEGGKRLATVGVVCDVEGCIEKDERPTALYQRKGRGSDNRYY